MKDAFSALNQFDAPHVLDAATGRGEFIHVLKQNLRSYVQIIGVDSSEKSVDYAQKAFPENDVEIYRMDLHEIGFEDATFDLVSMSNSLHHMEDPEKVLRELLRVLKPGGIFLLVEMYQDGEQTEAQKTHIMLHHWLAGIDTLLGVHHRETYTREEIMQLIAKLKLRNVKTVEFYSPVDNPKEARNCEQLRRNCLDSFKRLEHVPDDRGLLQAGKDLMERIDNIGCATASRLMIIGAKPQTRKVKIQGDK